jgi:hypothetical protein
MAKLGPPYTITDEIVEKLLDGIRANLPYDITAWSAGISEKTFFNWRKQGQLDLDEGLCTEFAQLLLRVKEAEALKIALHIQACEMQTERWQARMTILERRWREYFSADAAQIKEYKEMYEFFQKLNQGGQNAQTIEKDSSNQEIRKS